MAAEPLPFDLGHPPLEDEPEEEHEQSMSQREIQEGFSPPMNTTS